MGPCGMFHAAQGSIDPIQRCNYRPSARYVIKTTHCSFHGCDMTNLDFGDTPRSNKIFGTVETSVHLAEALGNDETVRQALSELPQVPMSFYRDNMIAWEGDAADYIFFVVKGVVRSCKIFKGSVRNIVAFYLPPVDRSGYRPRGTIYQTERIALPRVSGNTNCKFSAAGDDK